ncbi:hypothetical protein M436DRAFT_81927 [Aureobasidium namibiae CBS 147.97]|uniref:Uncharacterized protein n=1 Tax=Aureobasidium namibiae CBS 147.97 TaxID=1043004 RepID=A0A074XG24_9PEZI
MSYISEEEAFEDLWDQMEELSKSCDRADGKLSRGIARYLIGYINLPQSYRIRAHMALTSVLCAQDTLRDAEEDYAEVQVKVSAGRHAQMQAELHAELQGIRETYKEKVSDKWTVDDEDETADEIATSTLTESPQRGPGSQEDPIDLTLENESSSEDNTNDQSPVDSGYAEATDFIAPLPTSTKNARRLSIDNTVDYGMDLLQRNTNMRNTIRVIIVKESCPEQQVQDHLFSTS